MEIIIIIIILLGGGPMLFYIGLGIIYLIGSGFDTLFLKKGREKKAYQETVQWFESNQFFDGLSPYIREYIKTGHLDERYYDFEDELIGIIGNGNGFYPPRYYKGAYHDDWKETITTYRKLLINNLNNGKDYHTNKGIIRIVPIVNCYNGLRTGCAKWHEEGMYAISADTLRFDKFSSVPKAYTETLGKFGFTFIEGGQIDDDGWSSFEVVAYINLG